MYLKSLELQGFKSFPDKTKLTFEGGSTVIVGPNGSGKSNIADAMRWVLGEISSKTLRSTKMEDVIFGGADSRKPMGYAEVSVTLDNSDDQQRLDCPYDEVTVTRRYFRAGESEYYINRRSVRLRDINELFMDPGSFGELSPLATAIPEDDFSKGYLDNLSDFIIKTLHPFIN